MENVYTYLAKYCDKTFKEESFSDEDSIVLGSLSYLLFEKVLAPKEKKALTELESSLKTLSEGAILGEEDAKLLNACILSERFKDLTVENVVSNINTTTATQFNAMVFRLNETNLAVVFRGTDASLNGWKEDFKIALQNKIVSQTKALDYLKKVIKENKDSTIYVVGHSKGGNLAVYALLSIENEYLPHIKRVFDLDGPGFKTNLFKDQNYLDRHDKLLKIIPYDDVIGQVLNINPRYKVVKATLGGIIQHSPYTWGFKKGKLHYITRKSLASRQFRKAIDSFLKKTPETDLALFVKQAFSIIEDAGVNQFSDISHNTFKKLEAIVDGYEHLSIRAKNVTKAFLRAILRIYIQSFI